MTDTIGDETTMIPPLSRRTFFHITAAGAVVLTTGIRGSSAPALADGTSGTVLAGADIPKFVTPLLIPPAMPRTRKIKQRKGKNIDYYEIAMRQLTQQVLPGISSDDGVGVRHPDRRG